MTLTEASVYEASINSAAIDDQWTSFSQIYTSDSISRNVNVCKTYNATAPSNAGVGVWMTIPAAAIKQHGGVGFAGSCCPRWGITWDGARTTNNDLVFDNVYTNPQANDDGRINLATSGTVTVDVLANDAGFWDRRQDRIPVEHDDRRRREPRVVFDHQQPSRVPPWWQWT